MYDIVVIGGGSGGLNVAAAAANVGAKVALIERDKLGGSGVHAASVPSKVLVQSARLVRTIRGAERFGLRTGPLQVDFPAVMSHVRDVVAEFAQSDTEAMLRGKGIDVIRGSASFEAYDTVRVDGSQPIVSKRFVIATGSRPAAPEIPGLAEAGYLDTRTLWSLTALPQSLVVIGDDSSGLELAQCFARFGSKVTVLLNSPRILPNDDPEASALLTLLLTAEGLTIKPSVIVRKVDSRGGRKVCQFEESTSGTHGEADADAILVAGGRLANIEHLNLEAVGAHGDPHHGIEVDETLQTHSTRVFALGDVLMRHGSAQAAEREAFVVFQNAVLKLRRKVDYENLPWSTFVDPEVAAVGLSETQVREQQVPHRVYRAGFSAIDRARIDGRVDGFAKVISTPAGKVLGATVVGEHANLIIQELVLAREKALSLGDIAGATPVYPTYAEVVRHIANQYRSERIGEGFVQTVLKLFYGFMPSRPTDNETTAAEHESPADKGHATSARGH
jgi:pyruvate/2-oxoglutarate dehydrogenase complex dihydrolipoamide dehydrogenase (E3) component